MREIRKLECALGDLEFGLWDEAAEAHVTNMEDMAAVLECLSTDEANNKILDALIMFCADLKEKLTEDLGTLWGEIEKSK